MRRSLLMAASICVASALSLSPKPSLSTLSRRRVLELAPASAILFGSAQPAAAVAARKLDEIKVLTSKAKSLRVYVRQTAANRRLFPMDPDGGNCTLVIWRIELRT